MDREFDHSEDSGDSGERTEAGDDPGASPRAGSEPEAAAVGDDDPHPEGRHEPGSLWELITIAMPLVLSAGSLSLMNFCDRLFLTGYSEVALAASLPAHILHWVLLALPLGTAFYASTFVAQYDGAGRYARVGRSMWQAILLSLGTGVLMLALVPFSPAIFELSGHAPDVQQQEVEFFSMLCAGSVPILIAPTLACFYIGRGRSNVVLWANIASVVLNLILDPLLIYGWAGFPEWGAFGAAFATVCGRTLACLVYIVLMATSEDAKPYQMWQQRGFDPALFRRMLRFGLPNGFYWFVDVTAFSVMVFLVGSIGKQELAATTLAFSLNALAFIPMIGIGHSVSALVGRRIGEGRPDYAEQSTWAGFRLAGGYMAVWAIGYVVLPSVVIAPYVWMNDARLAAPPGAPTAVDHAEVARLLGVSPDEATELRETGELTGTETPDGWTYERAAVVTLAKSRFDAIRQLTVSLMWFVAIYSLFDAMGVVFSNAVRGAGDTKFAMLFTFATSWFLWAMPVIVLHWYGAGLYAMWTSCTLYIVVVGTGFLLRFLAGHWKSMKVIEDDEHDGPGDPEPMENVGVVAVPNPEIGDTVLARE